MVDMLHLLCTSLSLSTKQRLTALGSLHSRQPTAWATTLLVPCPKPTSKLSVNNSQHLSMVLLSAAHSALPKNSSKYFISRNPQTSKRNLSTPIPEMAPQTTAIADQEPSSAADIELLTWVIPFLAFYAFGILASMATLWAVSRFSNKPPWPPAFFRRHNRSGPLYQLVLYLPALVWLVVLAAGFLCLLGCALLHIWKWLVLKLASVSGRAGTRDEASPSRQTDGVGRVPLTPLGGHSADTTKGFIVQVEQETKGTAVAEEAISRSTLGSQEHSVNMHQLSTADNNTPQEPGEIKD